MSKFKLRRLDIPYAIHEIYSLVIDDKCVFEEFLKEVKSKFHLKDEEDELKFDSKPNELDELMALLEDVALGNTVLKKCHKPLKSKYSAYEIRTKKTMLRVYYLKEKSQGKIIILAHIKKNEKDQNRALKQFEKRIEKYNNYKQKNKIEIIEWKDLKN